MTMKGRENVKIKNLLGVMACCAALVAGSAAQAEETLLAQETLPLEQGEATAELWGDKLANGYAQDLLVFLKDKNGKILTAYAPTIKGGYNCLLNVVNLEGKEKWSQLLVSAGQGDWRASSEFRVLSFADVKNVQELFGQTESMGIVANAFIKDGRLELTLANGSTESVKLDAGVQAEDGSVAYGGLHSLAAWDIDDDGVDELLGSQRLVQGKTALADVGAIWKRDKEGKKWETIGTTIMTLAPVSAGNTVNDGIECKAGTLLPRRLVVRGGEATFPVFASKDLELQDKVNKALWLPNMENLTLFYAGKADMAFKVMRATDHLLSVQLISGKTQFRHQYVNINLKTGEEIKLGELLNTKDKDLLPLLNLLSSNKRVKFMQLPDEWYIEGKNLFLLQRVNGQEEVAGYDLGNLHKFILDKQILK